MSISITNVRIKNFRSLENIDVSLSNANLLIGQNNSGKSNFLKALNIAIGGNWRDVSDSDILVRSNEKLDNSKQAIIDILIKPLASNNKITKNFSDFWISVFTDKWISTDATDGDFVGIRTVIYFDIKKNDYTISRFQIQEWASTIEKTSITQKKVFGSDMIDLLTSFYMDAQRDAVEDLRDKKSYFGKVILQNSLSIELIDALEEQLNDINSKIVSNIPSLQQTNAKMSQIGVATGASSSLAEIEPLARKITDLHKGLDIVYKEGDSAKLPISQHGMGTRSWISFLTLDAYIQWYSERLIEEDSESELYTLLAMEEPEAHLHPQAQRKLYSQISKFKGQKIISTHSPNIIMQTQISDLLITEKIDGISTVKNIDISKYSNEEVNRIKREIMLTRGDLIFSNAIILCEGITEEQALPIFFKEYFGNEAVFYGINIIGIGGQNYKTFLNFFTLLNLKWYIFSDGEEQTIKTVEKAVKANLDTIEMLPPNVVILENGEDYEEHLLANYDKNTIISAINKYEENDNYFENFSITKQSDNIRKKRIKTNKPKCPTCKQDIYEDEIIDDSEEDRQISILRSCCKSNKAKYATCIAQKIVELATKEKRVPPKVLELFIRIEQDLNISRREDI